MNYESMLLAIVFVPVLGSFTLPLIGKFSVPWRNLFSLLLVVASFLFSSLLVPQILSGHSIVFSRDLALGFNFVFVADGLAVFMACVSSFLSAIILLYSFGYISHYEHQSEYYFMVVLFLGAMMGLIFSGNLILLYIFWEITAITSWRLIGFFRNREYVLKADKAFLLTMFGAILMLLGFIMIYQQTGSFDLAVIKEKMAVKPIADLAVALILAGILSKSATLPFHTWLPDAGVAPSPVTALLHAAILVKIGVYVYARLFVATIMPAEIWHTVVPVIAAASALVAAGAAYVETDLKRLIAFSTVSQIGFIFFGLSVGSSAGVVGGLLYILMHGIAKAGLFLCAGIIEQNTKNKDITKMGGLMTTMPMTAIAFLFCAFSVMGIPPFGGFFSKYLVFAGAVSAKQLTIGLVFLAGAFMTILYLFRVFNMVFLGEAKMPPVKEESPVMVRTVVFLGVLALLSGLLVYYPSHFVELIVSPMAGKGL